VKLSALSTDGSKAQPFLIASEFIFHSEEIKTLKTQHSEKKEERLRLSVIILLSGLSLEVLERNSAKNPVSGILSLVSSPSQFPMQDYAKQIQNSKFSEYALRKASGLRLILFILD
jgi:hypothetical protein